MGDWACYRERCYFQDMGILTLRIVYSRILRVPLLLSLKYKAITTRKCNAMEELIPDCGALAGCGLANSAWAILRNGRDVLTMFVNAIATNFIFSIRNILVTKAY